MGFPYSSDGKESACNAGGLGSISGSGISPGEGNGNPPQYSCLEANRWGKKWKQWQILFSWATKSIWMVTAAMKLKDIHLE